jgi:GMP synthase-like glutamine amidotransferase
MIVSRICRRSRVLKWCARVRILVIQHDADKGLGLFIEPLASHELDIQFAGHGELELAGHAAVIALPGVANPDDGTKEVDATREVLREALRRELPILGICLGAELLAEAAGGVTGPCRPEWGYREVSLAAAGRDDELLGDLPARFAVFQAHDYCFGLPPNAVALAHSPATLQAFRIGGNAWGVQFHPEPTLAMLDGWTGALGHVLEANGVDPEVTRRQGRRYVPEWAEHAATIGRRFAAATRAAV